MPDARIALIRHGQTEWSASGQHTSVTDIDLTPEGQDQAKVIPRLLAGLRIHPTSVLVSPRLRARRTAELAGLTVTGTLDDLAEWDYGDYEGLTSKEIHEDRPGWSVFTDGAPGGESPEDVTARADRALATAAESLGGGDVVLVCHGHISRVLAVRWVGLPITAGAAIAMSPAAVTVLGYDRGNAIIDHANVVPFAGTGRG
ncbi:histidine phosphatase family protein [Nakamurella endophytica]|uniref:Phosphoglycerate mutase n=1 Tax=Nakamurella endophytica TaxID=1748367 RepID=A0A917WAG1_9ACTN|nr:histidine phosphatase family protein [Nakamurella endophytica]GGL85782.1 phosphoglycerate mutase [Nakamurella endophytica]